MQKLFLPVKASPIYESKAVGFEGDNFLNLMVRIETNLALEALIKQLKAIEDQLGRERSGLKFSSRVIDIDVIFFGDVSGKIAGINLPRYEIYENAYILLPMKVLAPDFVDPKTGMDMKTLWDSLKGKMEKQKLWQLDV